MRIAASGHSLSKHFASNRKELSELRYSSSYSKKHLYSSFSVGLRKTQTTDAFEKLCFCAGVKTVSLLCFRVLRYIC